MKRCGATNRQGNPCGNPAGKGTDHPGYGNCKHHGGSSPNGRKHATRQAAEEAVVTYGLPVEIDPAEALLDEVNRTYGHVLWLLDKVQITDPDALIWGLESETDKRATEFPGVDRTYSAKANVWLDLYREERDHLRRVTTDALRAGVEERRVRLAERRGEELARWMKALAQAWGVPDTPETWKAARAHLQLVDGAG